MSAVLSQLWAAEGRGRGGRMTSLLDRELQQVAALVNGLPRRSQAAIFWAASAAHLESVGWWAEGHGDMSALLHEAQEAAYSYCVGGLPVGRAVALLEELDRVLPENLVAQSSWNCADAALRIVIDETFEPGMSIEYALEPVLGRTSEDLFGFWQVGSDAEDEDVAEIMAQPAVVSAIEFCLGAVRKLVLAGAPRGAVLAEIRVGAAVLTDVRRR